MVLVRWWPSETKPYAIGVTLDTKSAGAPAIDVAVTDGGSRMSL
jgi:hypothetical protein